MRTLLLTFAIISLLGCQVNQNAQIEKSRYATLLSKFTELVFDTVHVYPLSDDVTLDTYKFKGVKLDSLDAVLFPEKISKAHFLDTPGLYACYKFKIDSVNLGLIARTPSEYFPSSIKLFIYNSHSDTLFEAKELAEFIGDAGTLRDVNSWIFKDRSEIKVFTWLRDTYDNSLDNEKDTTISENESFTLLNLTQFKSDSLSTSKNVLPKNLLYFIKNKNSR
jgi:hypothetical protein